MVVSTSLKPHHLRMGGRGHGSTGWDRMNCLPAICPISCLLVFPSQLQAHMALQLCPVLGDHTYSARVGTVLGQRFLLPVESTKPQRQVPKSTCLQPSGVGWGLLGWRDG